MSHTLIAPIRTKAMPSHSLSKVFIVFDRGLADGVKLGGPIRIPKLYNANERSFFFNYEGLLQLSPYANTSSVPSAAFRSGDFSASPIPVLQPGTKIPFPDNVIPASLIDPAPSKILAVLSGANSPGSPDLADGHTVNNLVEVGSSKPGSTDFTTRIDENLSAKDRLFGTLTHYNDALQRAIPAPADHPGPLENAAGPGVTSGYQAAIGYTRAWTFTLVLEARVGFWRNHSEIVPPSDGLDVPEVFGIQRAVGPASPTFNLNGWSQYGLNSNTLRSQIDNTVVIRRAVVGIGVDAEDRRGRILTKDKIVAPVHVR
jgi:hypothetical protein